jgi:sigma-B regulation protein RsbU (phosphoserine phosphatase)
MLSLSDFFHLPQVDPIIEQLTHDGPGLIVVTGMDPRQHIDTRDPARFLPSGRAGIFRILVRHILEENPGLRATIVAKKREAMRVPRNLRRRVEFELVNATASYVDLIPAITHLHSGLLVVDQLSPENASVVLEAAQKGARIVSQMDTVFRGGEVVRALLEWDLPRGHLSGLRWVVAMQRIPMLCGCKRPVQPHTSVVEAIQRRYPHLKIEQGDYFAAGNCETCEHSGRHNEITAFDFFLADPDRPFAQTSLLPLEAYMLGLAQQGTIPLTDLLRIESDQLHRTYNLLTTSEHVLAKTQTTLKRKIVELETANRVLRNRTEELVSLQEIGQTLIGGSSLRNLALQVCRQASNLCGADRAIFYFLRDNQNADVLATHGWAPGRVPQQAEANKVCRPNSEPTPSPYNRWPPGVQPRHPDVEGARLRAGLHIPLIAQGQPVGAMLVHSTSHPHFHPGAMALLQTFANQAAVAIQRAGLIESLQDKIVQLEAAQEGLAQKERMDRELELAREVQQAVLPHTFPQITGYRFAARNRPARQVGGDFYDVIDLGKGRFGLVVADVSDKGMPAAVYMALTRSLMVAEARRASSPVLVLQNVNELLRELGRARMFVTVFYGVVDGLAGKLTFARAGHDRPLLIQGENIQELEGEGVFLGFLGSQDLHLTEESVELTPGDRLILYTDGLIDTVSPEGYRFDREGLHTLLRNVRDMPARELCDAVFDELAKFQGEAEQFDDMTLLVVEVDQNDNIPTP